jgi:rod shape-determining protein MreC
VYDHKTIRRRRAVLALLVVACLVLLTASFGDSSGPVGSVQRGVFSIVSPIQDGASRALSPIRDFFGWFGDTWRAKGDNDDLRRDRDKLRQNVAELQGKVRDDRELRALVELDRRIGINELGPVTARVVGASPTLFLQTININRGSSDGVKFGQAVVGSGDRGGAGALVGKVTKVIGGHAQVTLITDQKVRSAAITEGNVTGNVAVSEGNPRELILEFASPGDVETGQMVVTRGTEKLGDRPALFPPNIPIGQVTEVEEAGTDAQRVHIRPYANPRRLSYVQVITKQAPPKNS